MSAKPLFWLFFCLFLLSGGQALAAGEEIDPQQGDPRDARDHSGSAPVHPHEPDDEHFLVDVAPDLDTGCTFRNGGPLEFSILIDRYVGAVDGDGFLADPAMLIDQGVVSATARLLMPAFDVDSGATPEPPVEPEVDKVFLNGQELDKILTGENNTWIMNEFEVPIEILKFPQRGNPGSPPEAAANEIRIDIDTANADIGQEVWCTAIDWAQLQLEAMAPLLLVHGTNSGPDTWEAEVTDFLEARGIPFEHQIQLEPNGSIAANGAELAQRVTDLATSFGVEKVHLVVHSKGGLDSRRFLSTHYDPDEVRVLSLHTLASPHHGTVLSDLSVANRNHNDPASTDPDIEDYLDNDWWADFLGIGPEPPALEDQQTGRMRAFNLVNAFPAGIRFYTYGADADLNNDGAISDDEAEPLIDSIFVDEAEVGSLMYRILRDVASITVTRRTNFFGLNEWHDIDPVATTTPQANDLVVTDTSSRHPRQLVHFGPLDNNHANIKSAATMMTVMARIRADFPVN